MPEIKLTKENLDFLIDLGKRMNAQNNRATQSPMFVVKQKVRVYGERGWCSETERRDDSDGELCEECQKIEEEGGELPEYCPHCDDECFVSFNWEDEIVEDCGAFFTAEAAQNHIDCNGYHYHKPFVYGIPSWRNPEMKKVLEILSILGNDGGKPLDHYLAK